MRRVRLLALIVAVGLAAGCAREPKRGRIGRAPEGLLFDANASAARLVLAGRELIDQDGWFTAGDLGSSIMISRYAGSAGTDEIEAARAGFAGRYTYAEYGELEELTIDRRPSWGWLETQSGSGHVSAMAFTAVIPYGDETYTVEFWSAEPRFMDADALRKTVATFGVR